MTLMFLTFSFVFLFIRPNAFRHILKYSVGQNNDLHAFGYNFTESEPI